MDYIIKAYKSQKQPKDYFNDKTEEAILRYNASLDPNERGKIYEQYIHYPFYKLTENIIHTFKFYYTEVENLEDLQHEIMIFLLDRIHMFNPSLGYKAYSYFGTIVKNWLIIYNNNNYSKKKNKVSVVDLNNYSNLDTSSPEFINSDRREKEIAQVIEDRAEIFDEDELTFEGYKYGDKLSHFIDKYVEHCTQNIYKIFPVEEEAKIADAVLELFRKRDSIEIFNKKALYIYIREMVNVKTPKITRVASKLYKIFREKYIIYLETGYFSF